MGDNFPKPGGVFEGRYHIRSVIGRGGFAQIYLAEQVDLGREVALKVLSPDLRGSDVQAQEVAERFRREAKLVASLRDPHTIIMHDYGRTDDALLYMVFEYIDGVTLSGLVRREGRISADRTVKILRQCLLSLQEAHAMGVLHRDIKPANIMVYEHIGRTDQVKVLDFGIAKSVLSGEESGGRDLTQAGMIIGTPRYMAPEQLRGTPLGPQTDIYSLGLVAYELLSGHKAIELDSMVSIITRQVSDDPIRLPEDLPLSPRIAAIVNQMLHKSERERFQNAGEILRALDALSPQDLQAAPRVALSAEDDAEYKATLRMDPPVFAAEADFQEPSAPAPPPIPNPTPTSSMPAHTPPAVSAARREPPSHETPIAGGFSSLGDIPSPAATKSKSPAILAVALLLVILGGAGAYYLYSASQAQDAAASDTAASATRASDRTVREPGEAAAPKSPAPAPPLAPQEDPIFAEDTATAAIDIARQEAAQAVQASTLEQAQQAQENRDAQRQKERASAEAKRSAQSARKKTRRDKKDKAPAGRAKSAPAKKKSAKKKSAQTPPSKDDSSTSSFPALDGI